MATMSANTVLMKFFKLPPALRMVLALAGFGSLASILYTLLPALRTKQGRIWILIILGSAVLLVGGIWLIRRMIFGRKSAKLADALESQGPTRGDIAEQEQIYREKFRAKLAELKANGLSVYKLPWFVLIGEPGCGKTASLIHSGLDFPLGKDEVPGFGGTRNYNWWFANEAVILDTAGRIAFHEEGTTDKVEWEYFCKLLKQNRPRCPINGLIVALPADKLLRDSSEERAQKAAVLRERLRQIHQLLGVRFPTFVLVTKMDLVGGFSEFFEEIRVDLQQRNQMFGWSRPGEFQEPYDPKDFPEAFEEVAQRLRDWSMRYLQRKATEDELGMIVTFPEAFRQLGPALHDYVGTIFQKSPLLEPPFFRGFYFTSAVQEGAPILDVFTRTSTHALTERPAKAVDSKAFFIHDFYARKVFPEQGLVFRSARHVSLNRRMRRLVWYGSAAMILLILTFLGLGWSGTRKLVTSPQQACAEAKEIIAEKQPTFEQLDTNLRKAKELYAYYKAYDGAWNQLYARMLYIGANIRVPQRDVGLIHASYVLKTVVRPVLLEVEKRLAAESPTAIDQRQRYLAALRVFTQWYGEVVGKAPEPALTKDAAAQRRTEFETLLRYLGTQGETFDTAAEHFELALKTLAEEPRAFARDALGDPQRVGFAVGDQVEPATQTIVSALNNITDHWLPLTQIIEGSANADVKYWARFADLIAALRERYGQIMALRAQLAAPSAFQKAGTEFMRLTNGVERLGDLDYPPEPGTLNEALYNLAKFLEDTDPPETAEHRIRRLSELLALFAEQWNKEYDLVEEALARGAPDRANPPQKAVYDKIAAGKTSLQIAFENSLQTVRTKLALAEGQEPLDVFVDLNLIRVDEAQPPNPFKGHARIRLAPNALGTNNRLRQYLVEMRQFVGSSLGNISGLDDIRKWPALINQMHGSEPQGPYLSAWVHEVKSAPGGTELAAIAKQKSGLADRPFWRPADLYELVERMWSGYQTSTVDALLDRMAERAQATTRAARFPGVGRLLPDYDKPADLPFEWNRFNQSQAPASVRVTPKPEAPKPAAKPETTPPAEDEDGLPRLGRVARKPKATEPTEPDEVAQPTIRDEDLAREDVNTWLFNYHTRKYLTAALRQVEIINTALAKQAGGQPVADALDKAANAYIESYFRTWYRTYSDSKRLLPESTLDLVEKLSNGALSWPDYVDYLEKHGSEISADTADRMEALVREVVMFGYELEPGDAVDDAVYDRIDRVLRVLNRERQSVPHICASMLQRRNQPADNTAPEVAFSSQVATAWDRYVSQVRNLGALTPDKPSSNVPPDVRQLAETITYKQATSTDFPLIAPLVDISKYGQQLLVYHVDTMLAQIFGRLAGKFPVVESAQDASPKLSSLAHMPTADPRSFVDLLRQVIRFRDSYGRLYEELGDESTQRTFAICDAWTRFLYPDPSGLARGEMPPPKEVRIAIVRNDPTIKALNAASVYKELVITLPILASGTAAPPIKVQTRTGEGVLDMTVQEALRRQQSARYTWSLAAQGFGETTAAVIGKHPDARPAFPERASGWRLPGSPWTLLMLMGARPENDLGEGFWRIPVRMETGVDPVAFTIGVQLGGRGTTYPGPIPPFRQTGSRPRMITAQKYLSSQ